CKGKTFYYSNTGLLLCAQKRTAVKAILFSDPGGAGAHDPMPSNREVRHLHQQQKKDSCQSYPFSVTPERFISAGVKSFVYQYFRILENHGCSLFAHPEISMFFVYLQHKDSYNSLTNSNH
ncbi:hypothetical protein, partial [uncultured Muribaculum sp.]|uniref:hypothetical protein n=1 Tax=uncultured Muribaculum sp. TaxID=1918613 RepID=UPI0027320F41